MWEVSDPLVQVQAIAHKSRQGTREQSSNHKRKNHESYGIDFYDRYSTHKLDFDTAYNTVKGAIMDNFYGPPNKGVFSPSVQYTLFEMGKLAIQRWVQAYISRGITYK